MPTPNPDDINKALTTTFNTLATAQGWTARIEWPNKAFDPSTALTPWFRPTVLPGIPEPAGLGDSAPDQHVGIYQISIFTVKDVGDGPAMDLAALILAAFPRGGSATYGTATVIFEKSYALPAIVEEKFYHVPVRVEYRSEL